MLICKQCGADWNENGQQWKRKKGKWDYRCSICKSKLKPTDVVAGGIVDSVSSGDNVYGMCLGRHLDREDGYWTNGGKTFVNYDTEVNLRCERDDLKSKDIRSTGKRVKKKYENILLIGDLHLPFTLDTYLDFCVTLYNKYNCDHVIFLGDLLDNHYSSSLNQTSVLPSCSYRA